MKKMTDAELKAYLRGKVDGVILGGLLAGSLMWWAGLSVGFWAAR